MAVDIKKRRTELNLTLEQIGNYVGVSKSTVKKWENGNIKNMRRDKILLLSKILKVPPMSFINLTEKNNDRISDSSPHTSISHENIKKIEMAIGSPLPKAMIIFKQGDSYITRHLSDEQLNQILQNIS